MPTLSALIRAAALTAAFAAPALPAWAETAAPKKAVQSSAQTTAPVPEHGTAPASKPRVKRVAKTAPALSPASHAPETAAQPPAQTTAPVSEHLSAPALKPRVKRVAKAAPSVTPASPGPAAHDGVKALVSLYAQRHGVPETLAHRIVVRESRYNPALKGGAHFGLMQISLPTAKQMGYAGAPQGLLDARTNLSYGMPYLANAWLVSGGSEARAVSLYSRGYYYDAKRKGVLKDLRTARSAPLAAVEPDGGADAR